MRNLIIILSFSFTMISLHSCVEQESVLYDQYINLVEPRYFGDSVRMEKILKIHKKLLKKKPDNYIYLGNVFQMNCSLGNFEENQKLIEEYSFFESSTFNPNVYRNFYLALNAYREDPDSNYEQYLNELNKENLLHNPLLGYIAAKCTGNEELANGYFPEMIEYIRYMPERMTIIKMIESEECDKFLELYRGICPVCEICQLKYPI